MWYENLNILSVIATTSLVAILVTILLVKGKKEQVKKIILTLVIEAESKFGTGTGSIKYAYVLGLIYPTLPVVVRLLITEDALDNFIEEAVIILKNELKTVEPTSSVAKENIESNSKTEVRDKTTIK